MSKKIGRQTSNKLVVRFKRKRRIRGSLEGTTERPRLAVFRSNRHISVQVIDDTKGATLVAATTLEADLKSKVTGSVDGAKAVGGLIAKRALAKNISQVVFDRSGYLYHGRIKALADAAREAGLKF
ncbi:MAG: 50S ribosomal protein L18 [Oligoflexia bacterium]|jgi:large subunit ribosomal protein L18